MGLVRDYAIGTGIDLDKLLAIHGLDVQVTRQADITRQNSNVFGTIDHVPPPFTARILSPELEIECQPTEAGGKNKEKLHFICRPGTMVLDDEIKFINNHVYKVEQSPEGLLGGNIVIQMCMASREVD